MARNRPHVFVLLAVALLVLLAGFDVARALDRPEVVAGMPTTLRGAQGMVSGRDHDHIWVGFGVEAPIVALTNVVLVSNPIVGMQHPEAYVVSMSSLLEGDATEAPRMSTIPKGRTFAVVIEGLPTCEVAPPGQSILVRLSYDTGLGRRRIMITGPAIQTGGAIPYGDLCG